MNRMINAMWLVIEFAGLLGLGLVAAVVYELLPDRIKDKIEKYHEE